jgi:aminocarboxymuconate-semialdehyde decarboxylase
VKVDLHTHILPRSWPDLKARYGYGGFLRLDHVDACSARMMQDDRFFRAVEHNLWDPEARLEECEKHGVSVQVLSTVPVMFSYWARPEHALDLSRLLNDHIAEVVSRYPTRFVGLCTLPMQDPELAARELERCVKELGFPGAQIATHINQWNLDDEALFPFYAACEELTASLFVHPWDILAPERMERHWLKWLVGMPAETAVAMASVIMGGVLERYPRLKMGFAHGGGAFAPTIGRIDHGFHARPDLCQTRTTTTPSEQMSKLYVDSLVHDPALLRLLIERFGPERVALGSDYPFPLGELEPGQLVESCEGLSPAVRAQILGKNALEFLGRQDLGAAQERS